MKACFISTLMVVLVICQGGVAQSATLKQVLDALNKARTNPAAYSTLIASDYKAKTGNNNIHTEWNLQFNEVSPAQFDGAVTFLNSQSALNGVTIDLGLTYTIWKHVKWCSSVNNGISHTGEGGSTFGDRSKEFTSATSFAGAENLLSNSIAAKTAEHMTADYIIDDGVTSRGHRTNLFNSGYTMVGLGLYKGADNKLYYGQVFTAGFNCDKCSQITCQMQQDCGWTQYLKDTNQNDPCTASGNTGSGTGANSGQASGSGSKAGTGTDTSANGSGANNPTAPIQLRFSCISGASAFLLALLGLLFA